MYVRAYEPRRQEDEIAQPETINDWRRPRDTHDIYYSPKPVWMVEGREWALAELQLLHSMRVHVGPHYCELELEESEPGKFAFICNSHPEPKAQNCS